MPSRFRPGHHFRDRARYGHILTATPVALQSPEERKAHADRGRAAQKGTPKRPGFGAKIRRARRSRAGIRGEMEELRKVPGRERKRVVAILEKYLGSSVATSALRTTAADALADLKETAPGSDAERRLLLAIRDDVDKILGHLGGKASPGNAGARVGSRIKRAIKRGITWPARPFPSLENFVHPPSKGPKKKRQGLPRRFQSYSGLLQVSAMVRHFQDDGLSLMDIGTRFTGIEGFRWRIADGYCAAASACARVADLFNQSPKLADLWQEAKIRLPSSLAVVKRTSRR